MFKDDIPVLWSICSVIVSLYIPCMGWVGGWDQTWTDSGSQRRVNKLTSDLTQVEL